MIPEGNPYNNWSGNGSTTTFDFDFYIEDSSQLEVYYTDTSGTQVQLTEDVDYTINEVGNEDGSYITFPVSTSSYSVLKEGEVISLVMSVPITQEEEYTISSKLNLEQIEYSLDKLTRICKILKRELERAVKVVEGGNIDTDELVVNINTLTAYLSVIEAVNNNSANINTVADNEDNINTVAVDISNINSVSQDLTNIDIITTDLTNIDTVAENISDINTCAANIEDIQNASENAQTAITKVAEANTSADNAQIWAEGDDEEVEELGGTHSSKVWANISTDRQLQADWKQEDDTQKDYIKNKPQIQYNVFCINTGEVDTSGEPAFLSLSDNILTTSGSFDVTTANGNTYTVTDTLTLDISDYEDGEYNVYVNPVDLTISIKSHTLTADKAFPDDAETGDYLLNTSQIPYDLQQLTDDGTETGLNEVLAGTLTISSGTGSLSFENYNNNLRGLPRRF